MTIIYIAVGIGLFFLIRSLNKALHSLASGKKMFGLTLQVFPLFELIVWIAYALWVTRKLLGNWNEYRLISMAIIFIPILLISWYFLRDFMAGIVLKAEKPFTISQLIKTRNFEGTIKKIGSRSIEIESKQGQISRVPFSRLTNKIYSIQTPEASIRSHELLLQISSSIKIEETKKKLITELFLLPQVSVNHTPKINIVKEGKSHITYRISYHTSDQTHAALVNQYLKNKFEKQS